MEEARRVLERLARIADLERERAAPSELLVELRALVREAEVWVQAEPEPGAAEDALERCRAALESRDSPEVVLFAG